MNILMIVIKQIRWKQNKEVIQLMNKAFEKLVVHLKRQTET